MAHKPTKEQRQMVEILYGFGLPLEEIASVLKISRKTLSAHYKEELTAGKSKMDAVVLGQYFKKIRAGNTACILFYMKCRMGWKTNGEIPYIPGSGQTFDGTAEHVDLAEMSEQELDAELERRGLPTRYLQ